jgi:protoporphyrin/coproporphyrin ferrochelatase
MKKALVLLNMGGARNKSELELFLKNMFNDNNILTIKSDFLRWILASLIVFSRTNSAWKNYELIGSRSPINPLTQKLVSKLQNAISDIYITHAMRYTPPFAIDCIKNLEDKNIEDVILLPLYPQYSTTTTKSSVEEFVELSKGKFNLNIIKPFYKNTLFNNLILEEIFSKIVNKDYDNYDLVFSAHGLPQKIVDDGDPYQIHLEEQLEILKNKLSSKNIKFKSISLAYQSKVGPLPWLKPSLDDRLKELQNSKSVIIYPISFIIDNSETDFELDIEYREIAQECNIKEFIVCKCPNHSNSFINVIFDLINYQSCSNID